MSTTADNQNRVTQAIAEYMRRVDAGEAVDSDAFIKAHSEVAEDLKRYLDNVALVEQMAGPTPAEQSQSPGHDASRRETVSASQGGDSIPEQKSSATDGPLSGAFGRYKIEKTLGEGAMGTVYLANDTQLDRRVALKIPKFKDDDAEMMERFYREARSAARLRHRHICPVHDIGEIDGIKYISIAYIEGHQLSAYVSPDKPQSERNIAIIVRKLALALQVAHNEGIIHRDLKPANVMVDKKTEPVIMDFGLARQMNTGENERLTQTGTIMGSPAYMSPEQVDSDDDKMGPCSDVYSLGVMLYELLTGRLPFEGSIAAVIGQILMKEPEKPSTLRPDLDPRLEEICAKMMAKQVEERYTSMKEVADALTSVLKNKNTSTGKRTTDKLESFAPVELKELKQKPTKQRRTKPKPAGQPRQKRTRTKQAGGKRKPSVDAKPQTAFDRLKNLSGRAKAIAGGCAALLLVLGITVIIKVGDQTLELTTTNPHTKVEIEGDNVKVTTGGDEGSGAATIPGNPDAATKVSLVATLTGHTKGISGIAFTKNGKRLISSSKDGTVRTWDVETGRSLSEFNTNYSSAMALSPDGKLLALTSGKNCRVSIWDLAEQKRLRNLTADDAVNSLTTSVAFAPDGKTVAAVSKDNIARIWDVASGTLRHQFVAKEEDDGYDAAGSGIAYSNDGRYVIARRAALKQSRVYVFDLQAGNVDDGMSFDLKIANDGPLALSPDGKQLAVPTYGKGTHLVDLATGQFQGVAFGEEHLRNSVCFSPNGRFLACGGISRVGLHDLTTNEQVAFLELPESSAVAKTLAFSPDGQYLAAGEAACLGPGCPDGEASGYSIRLWRLSNRRSSGNAAKDRQEIVAKLREYQDPDSVKDVLHAVGFWPDGNSLLDTFGPERRLRRRDVLTGETIEHNLPDEIATEVQSLSFSADGRLLAVGTIGGQIRVWDIAARKMKQNYNAGLLPVRGVSFSTDATRVLGYVGDTSRNANIVGFDIGAEVGIKTFPITCYNSLQPGSISFSQDGTQVAVVRFSGRKDGVVELWNVADGGKSVRTFDTELPEEINASHNAIFTSVVFSPDGTQLIAASDAGLGTPQGLVHIWNIADGSEHHSFLHQLSSSAVAMSPDGRWIISSEYLHRAGPLAKTIGCYVVDARTGERVHTWKLPSVDPEAGLRAFQIEFSPDGKRFLTAGVNTPLTAWSFNPTAESSESHLAMDLPTGQWVRLLGNEEQLKQWQVTNVTPEFKDGTVKLARGKKTDASDNGNGRLERVFDTTAERLMVHVRHNKIHGFMAGESVRIGSQNYHLAHFGPEKHELWTTNPSGKGSRRKAVHDSTDGYKDFADCDYVFLDGKFTAYLNGIEICSDTATPAPLTSIALDVRIFKEESRVEAEWQDIAVMRLSDEQVAAIRAGNLPRYFPVGEEYKRPEELVRTGSFGGNVHPVRYTPDGRSILGIQWGNFRLGVYDATTGKRTLVSDIGWKSQEEGGWITALAVSPVGTLAAGGSSNGKLLLWDYETGKLKHELKGLTRQILEAEFTADGKRLIASSMRDGIHVWNVETGRDEQSSILSEPKTAGYAIAFSPNGTLYAEGGRGRLNVRDMNTGSINWSKTGNDRTSFTECTFSPDSKRVAAYVWSPDKASLYVYDTSDGNIVSEVIMVPRPIHPATNLRFFAENRMLLVSHAKGPTRLWDIASGQLLQRIEGADAADVSPDGKTIVTKGPNSTVRTWRLDDENYRRASAGPTITAEYATYETLRSGSWQDFFSKADDLPQDEAITFNDGKITLDDRKLRIPGLQARNVAVRVRIKKETGRGFGIHLRSKVEPEKDDDTLVVPNDGFKSDYAFWAHGPKTIAGINYVKAGQAGRKSLAKTTLDIAGSEFELLVAAIDDRLLYFVDGKLVTEARDSSVSEAGEIVLGSYSAKFTMSDVAVRVLDDTSNSITPADGWVDLLPLVDSVLDTEEGKWRLEANELVGSGKYSLPIQPDGNYEWETTFTLSDSGGYVNFTFPDPFGFPFAEVIGAPGLKNFRPAGSQANAKKLQAAPAVSTNDKHALHVSHVKQNDETTITVTIDGKPWAEWSGKAEDLESRSVVTVTSPQIVARRKITIHSSRLRMLDGEAKVLRYSKQEEPTVPSSPAQDATTNSALQFDGLDSYVVIRKLRFDGKPPWTLEAVVTPQRLNEDRGRMTILGDLQSGGTGLVMVDGHWSFWVNRSKSSRKYVVATSTSAAVMNQRVHIAGVWDGQEVRLYVDGKLQAREAAVGQPRLSRRAFLIGADPNTANTGPVGLFKGLVEAVRISKAECYKAEFVPEKRFKPDRGTIVLFHCDEGKGKILKDATRNGNIGDIVDASWVKVGGVASSTTAGTEYEQLTAGSWTRVLNKRSEFSRVPNARLSTTGILMLGTVVRDGDAHVGIRDATGDDYLQAGDFALRMKVKRLQGRNFYFLFRQVKSNGYVVSTNGRDVISAIRKIGFAGLERQITGPQSIEVDGTDWVEWMLVARGKTMTVYAGGRKVLTFSDSDFQRGGIAIGADQSRMQFKEVELQLLESGNADSNAVAPKSTPTRQWLAPKVNSGEIKRAIAGLLKNGFFGRPPDTKAMEKYTNAEVARRKADGRMSPNGKIEYRFNSVGKIVFESASDSPAPSGQNKGGGGTAKKKR